MPSVEELLTDELQQLLAAERQLVKALPKFEKVVSDEELRNLLREHVHVTKNHVTRLESLDVLGARPLRTASRAMAGLIQAVTEGIQANERGQILDFALIGGLQKIKHYEIAAYGTARALARSVNHVAAALLQESLREEEKTDKTLTNIARRLQSTLVTIDEDLDRATGASRGDAVHRDRPWPKPGKPKPKRDG